jgi:hypothetical protein
LEQPEKDNLEDSTAQSRFYSQPVAIYHYIFYFLRSKQACQQGKMANTSSICIMLLPLIFAAGAAIGTRSQAPPELEQQLSTLKTCLNNSQFEKEELEEEIEELSGSLTLAEAETRSLREHVGKLQDQLNDARDLAFANILMQ